MAPADIGDAVNAFPGVRFLITTGTFRQFGDVWRRIDDRRMEPAAALLRRHGASIAAVASEVGYGGVVLGYCRNLVGGVSSDVCAAVAKGRRRRTP